MVGKAVKQLAAGVVHADLGAEEEALAPLVVGPRADVHPQRAFSQLLADPTCAIGIGEEFQAPDAGEHIVDLPDRIPRRAPPLGVAVWAVAETGGTALVTVIAVKDKR